MPSSEAIKYWSSISKETREALLKLGKEKAIQELESGYGRQGAIERWEVLEDYGIDGAGAIVSGSDEYNPLASGSDAINSDDELSDELCTVKINGIKYEDLFRNTLIKIDLDEIKNRKVPKINIRRVAQSEPLRVVVFDSQNSSWQSRDFILQDGDKVKIKPDGSVKINGMLK